MITFMISVHLRYFTTIINCYLWYLFYVRQKSTLYVTVSYLDFEKYTSMLVIRAPSIELRSTWAIFFSRDSMKVCEFLNYLILNLPSLFFVAVISVTQIKWSTKEESLFRWPKQNQKVVDKNHKYVRLKSWTDLNHTANDNQEALDSRFALVYNLSVNIHDPSVRYPEPRPLVSHAKWS